MSIEDVKLKPCPFCGAEPLDKVYASGINIWCPNGCVARSSIERVHEDVLFDVEDAWNHRHVDRKMVERIWDVAFQAGYDASSMKMSKWGECDKLIAELERENEGKV